MKRGTTGRVGHHVRRRLFCIATGVMLACASCPVSAQSAGDFLTGLVRGATGLPVPSLGDATAEPSTKGKTGGTAGQAVYVCAKRVGEGNAAFAQKEGVMPGLGGGWAGVAERKKAEADNCFNAPLASGLSDCRDIGYGCSECRAKTSMGRSVFVVRGSAGALGRCP